MRFASLQTISTGLQNNCDQVRNMPQRSTVLGWRWPISRMRRPSPLDNHYHDNGRQSRTDYYYCHCYCWFGMVVICNICLAFRDISEKERGYLRSLILHTKLVHRQAGISSSECQVCRNILAEIMADRQESTSGNICKSTLNLMQEHIISLHEICPESAVW